MAKVTRFTSLDLIEKMAVLMSDLRATKPKGFTWRFDYVGGPHYTIRNGIACYTVSGCRTAGCAIGLAKVLYGEYALGDRDIPPGSDLAKILGLERWRDMYPTVKSMEKVTPVMVADHLELWVTHRRWDGNIYYPLPAKLD